jgi:hypothetical protein
VALVSEGQVLDMSKGHQTISAAGNKSQHRLVSAACLRFLDGETDFTEAESLALVRGLQGEGGARADFAAYRLRWFLEVRECRRRVRRREILTTTSLGKG